MVSIEADSVFNRRVRLYQFVKSGEIGLQVAYELLPGGEPLLYERALWDYKLKFPSPTVSKMPDELRHEHITDKQRGVGVTFRT